MKHEEDVELCKLLLSQWVCILGDIELGWSAILGKIGML